MPFEFAILAFIYFKVSKANWPSSAMLLPLYNSCSSFKAVIPKDTVAASSNGRIGSSGPRLPPKSRLHNMQRVASGPHLSEIFNRVSVDIPDHIEIIIQYFVEILVFRLRFCRIIGRFKLIAPRLNLPTKIGLSCSCAGSIPPRSYQGLKKARHPIGLTTLPYFLYISGTYPSPVNDSQSGYIVFAEHFIPSGTDPHLHILFHGDFYRIGIRT